MGEREREGGEGVEVKSIASMEFYAGVPQPYRDIHM